MKKLVIVLVVFLSVNGGASAHTFLGCVADVPQCGEACGENVRMTVIYDDPQCAGNPSAPHSCFSNS